MANLGRYTLLRRVGEGGMAEVWKAKVEGPAGFEKLVAIKRIRPDHTFQENFIRMFVEEAKMVARLQHPNIVQVFDFGAPTSKNAQSDYFIAMEYISGQNLSLLLKRMRERKMKVKHLEDIAIFIVSEIAKGLAFAHADSDSYGKRQPIIHRDLTPHNVMISYTGAVKIADFGIAKLADAADQTRVGHVKGKISYLSPEQVRLAKVDHRTDLFNLGVVLYELLAGRKLFERKSTPEVLQLIREFDPFTSPAITFVPPHMQSLVQKALNPDPAQRYQDAWGIEAALAAELGPERLMLARKSLVALMQSLFAKEFQNEMDDEDDEKLKASQRDSATLIVRRPTPEQLDDATRRRRAADVAVDQVPTVATRIPDPHNEASVEQAVKDERLDAGDIIEFAEIPGSEPPPK